MGGGGALYFTLPSAKLFNRINNNRGVIIPCTIFYTSWHEGVFRKESNGAAASVYAGHRGMQGGRQRIMG